MDKKMFTSKYKSNKMNDSLITSGIESIKRFEKYVDKDINDITIDDIRIFMKFLIKSKQNTVENVIHFTRYFYYINHQTEYIHMMKYFNTIGVLENIIERISLYSTNEEKENIKNEVTIPPFGTEAEELPSYIKPFLSRLNKNINCETCDKILAGNNHSLSRDSCLMEKEYYDNSNTLDDYLKDRHHRKIQELTEHMNQDKVWYEQVITPEVIEFVKNNPEILSGRVIDGKLYITKIPYDINSFLEAESTLEKCYHACHCSFVKENIKSQELDIPSEWCYCSGGFAKFPFEVILNQDLPIKLLETPLKGDTLCRFEIDLSTISYK